MRNSPFDLSGKVAVVTGSSRGIGRASAEMLAQMGAKVVVSSRKADACEAVADDIRKAGGDAHVIPCNISRREEVDALIAGTIKHYGKIDVLVCNAAVNPYYGPLLDINDEAFDKIMGANIKSNIWLCKQAIPHMAGRGGGSVVIISSTNGLRGTANTAPYTSTKHAVVGLARTLANELGPKRIRVNTVHPGAVGTAMVLNPDTFKRIRPDLENPTADDVAEVLSARNLLPVPWVEPVDVSNAVVFLASDEGRYITGTQLVVDAGLTQKA